MKKQDKKAIKKFLSKLNPKLKIEKQEIDKVKKMTEKQKLNWLTKMKYNTKQLDIFEELLNTDNCGDTMVSGSIDHGCNRCNCHNSVDGGGNWGSGYSGE